MTQRFHRRAFLGSTATVLLASGAAVALVRAAAAQPLDVTAKKFQFVPNEIRARKGVPITLRFTAPEVPMGVNFADFHQRADIVPGQPALLTLVPDRAGSFTFVCDVFCGTGHEDMSGTLLVSD